MISALRPLPSARSEASFVAQCHAPGSRVLVGETVTEEALMRLADADELRGFDTIHIATHAVIDNDQPERCALVVSQLNLPSPLEAALHGDRIFSGCVTAGTIARDWRLDAELVVLSACGTGLGRAVPGEGYIGFAHAFLQAGARAVIVSLWPVEDRSTFLLMQRFYETWRGDGVPKADALQAAKHWLCEWRDDRGERPYADPFFWAGFVLIGDGG